MDSALTRAQRIFLGLALLASLLVLILPSLIPPKTLTLLGKEAKYAWIYDDSHDVGSSEATWLGSNQLAWRCTFDKVSTYSYCGYTLFWSEAPFETINFDDFDALIINLEYQGDSARVRLGLRNLGQTAPSHENYNQFKFNATAIMKEETGRDTRILLNEFYVPEWWMTEMGADRSDAKPSMNAIVGIAIDFANPTTGIHDFKLNKLVLVGHWLNQGRVNEMLLFIWLAGIGLYTLYHEWLYRRMRTQQDNRLQLLQLEKRQLQDLSYRDGLTALLNRHGLQERLKAILNTHQSFSGYGLLVIDIDHFKSVNDNFGHNVGDQVLITLCNVIQASLRDTDIFARWGGEELLILFEDEDKTHGRRLAEKLLTLIRQTDFELPDKRVVTISIGISYFSDSDNFSETFHRADQALYQAKSAGRNCFHQQ